MTQEDFRPAPVFPVRMRLAGRLIAVEGIDGSGKSTQLRLLGQWLQDAGHTVHLTSWNSSPLVRGDLRKAKRAHTLTPRTFTLMHAADLADRLNREILPALRVGHVVLADRWVYTALARDVARGMDEAWIRSVYAMAPRPHLTVFFRAPVEVALQRIMVGREQLRHYEAGMDMGLSADPRASFLLFQRRVLDRYDALAQSDGLAVIDALLPVAKQQHLLRGMVGQLLRRRKVPRGGG